MLQISHEKERPAGWREEQRDKIAPLVFLLVLKQISLSEEAGSQCKRRKG